jgi:hypothetical protein
MTALVEFVEVWRLTSAYERPPMAPDAGVFQHIGWHLTNGGRLYVDVWEPKLPLPFETTAILSLIAGDDMYLYQYLNVGLMVLAVIGIVLLVGTLTHQLTDDPFASTVAGFSMLLLPGFAIRPAYGFKAKYLLLFTGLLAIYLLLNDYPFASGVAAAASVGYWQLGAIFPLLVVGLALHRSDWRTVVAVVLGGGVFTVVMLAPTVVLWQSTSEMVAQVVLIPMLADDSARFFERLVAGVVHFKWASPFVLLGVYGLLRGVRDQLSREDWWLLVGAGWFGFVILFVDFDVGGYTDLIPGLAFVAIGIGLLSTKLTTERLRYALTAALVSVVVLNVVAFGSVGLVFPATDTPAPVAMDDLRTNERALELSAVPDDTHDVRYYYWNREVPETCHYRLSLMEVHWLQSVGSGDLSGCSDLQEVRAVQRGGG